MPDVGCGHAVVEKRPRDAQPRFPRIVPFAAEGLVAADSLAGHSRNTRAPAGLGRFFLRLGGLDGVFGCHAVGTMLQGVAFAVGQFLSVSLVGKNVQRLYVGVLGEAHHTGQGGFRHRYLSFGIDKILPVIGRVDIHHQKIGLGHVSLLELGTNELQLGIAVVHGFPRHLDKIFPMDEIGVSFGRFIANGLPGVLRVQIGAVQTVSVGLDLAFRLSPGVERHCEAPAIGKCIAVRVRAHSFRGSKDR